MLARAALAVLALSACKYDRGAFHDGGTITDDGGKEIDAPLADARTDAPPNFTCFGVGLDQECYDNVSIPSGNWTPTSPFDTSNNSNCTRIVSQGAGNPELCIHAAGTINVSGYTRVVGTRAAVFLATDSITVSNLLDASSYANNGPGAAANTGPCNLATKGTDDLGPSANAGAGGGGGGGFGTGGGAGAPGANGTISGGTAGGSVAVTVIRGGCRGGAGGNAEANQSGGAGGNGGGAIYLIAKNTITITGSIRANGAAGRGGGNKAGGGGGGSGGLVGLDAPAISVGGTIYANGGGGGEGGDGDETGATGLEPSSYNNRAPGGSGGADNGGDGGDGSVGTSGGVVGGGANNGGGGGGGGGGRVKVYPPRSLPGMISPPAT